MKKQNRKLTTIMLAGALCAATISGFAFAKPVTSSAEEATYALDDVFAKTSASFLIENNAAAFEFSDEGNVSLKRDLAFAWYEGKNDAKYLSLKFAFKTLDFTSVSFTVESVSAWATTEEKATNVVKFTNKDGVVSVAVNDGASVATKIAAGADVQIALKAGEADGEFGVDVIAGGETVNAGKFENVGANYADYTYGEMNPLQISADLAEGSDKAAKLVVLLKDINGQSFENAIAEDSKKIMIKDTAAPVLVVNEEIGSFALGTAFSLNYEKVDVLQSSNYTDSKTYYQYNPKDTEKDYVTLSTSVYFMDTVYEKDGKTTSVYKEEGREYVSIKVTLGDKAFADESGDFAKKEYDLSWYANEVVNKDGVDYIVVDRNEDGATYNRIALDDENKVNVVDEKLAEEVEIYQELLNKAAEPVYAGSNSYINFPSVAWLIDDNDGYRNLKFTVSYKTPSSDSAKTSSSLSYNGLKLSVADEGMYEFKIFANDKTGNAMQYYLDGELVSVTSSNVWDIEEIPSFTFEIKNQGLKMKDETSTSTTNRKATEDVGDTYSFSDLTVIGATNLGKAYSLYRIDETKANAIGLTESVLTDITYKSIRDALTAERFASVSKDEYLDLYLTVYAELLAKKIGGTVTASDVAACFVEIQEFDDRIDEELHSEEWDKNNKYNWTSSAKSFTAVEEGKYVIMADYWEQELPSQRVAAYKVVVVESKVDSIEGEGNSWLKNNVVSVVLFSVAGLMLILIVILLLVKPSDETMEDIDKKAAKKAEKETKEDK